MIMLQKSLYKLFICNGRTVTKDLCLNPKSYSYMTHNKCIYNINKDSSTCFVHKEKLLIKCLMQLTHPNRQFSALAKNKINVYSFLESSDAYCKTLAVSLQPKDDLQVEQVEQVLQKNWINLSNSEVLHNFELLSYHALKNDEAITDPKYECVVKALTHQCPTFSDKELHHLLSCLEFWKKDNNQEFFKLWKIIDNECLKRMINWTTDEILLTNDQYYKLKLHRTSEFSWKSLKKLANKLRTLSPENLIQLSFLLTFNRRVPLNMYYYEYYLEKNFDKYTIDEVSLATGLFIKYEYRIKNENLLLQLIKKLNSNINNIKGVTLKNIVQVIGYTLNPNIKEEYNILLKSLENEIYKHSLLTLAHIINMQKNVIIHNNALTVKIVDRFEKEIKSANIKNIEFITKVLSFFNYDSKTTSFYSTAMNYLMTPDQETEIERFPETLLQIVMNMVQVNFIPESILNRIMEPSFVNKVCKGEKYKLSPAYLLLDFCLELEHPEYNGPRLSKDLLDFLVQKFGSLHNERPRDDSQTKVLKDVTNTCKQVLNSPSSVHMDYLLPHYNRKLPILCYKPESKEYLLPQTKLSQIPLGTVKYAPDDGNKWIVLFFLRPKTVINDTNIPLGPSAMLLRHLQRIGYTPITINTKDWQSISDKDHKKDFISKILY